MVDETFGDSEVYQKVLKKKNKKKSLYVKPIDPFLHLEPNMSKK